MQEAPPLEVPSEPEPTSVWSKLANVLATPGDVFDEIKATPPCAFNWIAPAMLSMIMGVISVWVIFSHPAYIQQIREAKTAELDRQVKAGKLNRAQADQADKVMEKLGPAAYKAFGIAAVIATCLVVPFWWGLVVWTVGGILKGRFPYMKAVECAGIASILYFLAFLVGLLLALTLARLYVTPSLGLFVKDFDPANKLHMALASVHFVYLWYAGLLAMAVSRLSNVSFSTAAAAIFGLWIALRLIFIPLGLGQIFM